MTTDRGRPAPTGLLRSSSNLGAESAGPHATRLARRGRRRQDGRDSRPFPSAWHRARSATELLVVVVLLGLLTAALAAALMVAAVVVASHVLDG